LVVAVSDALGLDALGVENHPEKIVERDVEELDEIVNSLKSVRLWSVSPRT